MQVLSMNIGNIDIALKYGNQAPKLEVVVDKRDEEIVYQSRKGMDHTHTLYWGQAASGMVSFFAHNRLNQSGFGGHTFHLRMEDGSEVSIKGPWSSNSEAMNHYFPHSVECVLIEQETQYRLASQWSIESIKSYGEIPGWSLIEDGTSYYWLPTSDNPLSAKIKPHWLRG